MYAIIRAGGKQYRVTEQDVIAIERLGDAEGDEIAIDQVLLVSADSGVKIGTPYVVGAQVTAKVIRHYKGRKIHGFTYKPKKDQRKRYGHRQLLSSVQITDIKLS